MAAVSMVLSALQAAEGPHVPGPYDDGTMAVPPAQTIGILTNGPGYLPWGHSEWNGRILGIGFVGLEHLPGVVFFWALVGWALDRKLQGKVLLKNMALRWVLFLLLFGLCTFALFDTGRIALHHWRWVLAIPWREVMHRLWLFGLWVPDLHLLAMPVWPAIGSIYFGLKLSSMLPWRDRKRAASFVTS